MLHGTLPTCTPTLLRDLSSQLYCTTRTAPTTAPVAPHLFNCTYQTGLAKAAALQQQSVKPSTVKARNTMARELMDWLHGMNRTTPEDILVFFTQHWLPHHAGSPPVRQTHHQIKSCKSCNLLMFWLTGLRHFPMLTGRTLVFTDLAWLLVRVNADHVQGTFKDPGCDIIVMLARSLARCRLPFRRTYTSEGLSYKTHGNPSEVLSLQKQIVAPPEAAQVLVDFLAVC